MELKEEDPKEGKEGCSRACWEGSSRGKWQVSGASSPGNISNHESLTNDTAEEWSLGE